MLADAARISGSRRKFASLGPLDKSTNSNPYSRPSLCRTRADVGAPATGSSRTVSPSLSSPLTIADIPLTLISTLIPGMAMPLFGPDGHRRAEQVARMPPPLLAFEGLRILLGAG